MTLANDNDVIVGSLLNYWAMSFVKHITFG
jgi:hypothetical protein